jgi:copper(I)-binding protein
MIMNFRTLSGGLLMAACFALFPAVHAHDYRVADIRIDHPWARPTVPGQQGGGAFMKLANGGDSPDRLVGVSSPVARSTELHTMTMDGNVMRMRPVDAIELPARQVVELKPGGLHVMFMGLNQPLKVGESVPLTLKFERAGEVVVQVKVEPMSGPAPSPAHSGQHGHGAHRR